MKSPYFDSNGKSVPRATTILDQLSKPALIQWAANVAVDSVHLTLSAKPWDVSLYPLIDQAKYAYKQESREAVEYGSYIHKLCELYLRTGQKIESPHEMTQEFFNGTGNKRVKFNGFYDFCKKTHLKPLLMEQVVIGEGYGGRFDLICEIDKFWEKSDERVVTMIDFKTGKDTFYETWGMQLAGYRRAWNKTACSFRSEKACKGRDCEACPSNRHLQGGPILTYHHGVLKFNKTNNRVNYKDFTPTYEKDWKSFKCLTELWWLRNGEKLCKTEQ